MIEKNQIIKLPRKASAKTLRILPLAAAAASSRLSPRSGSQVLGGTGEMCGALENAMLARKT